MDIKTIPAVIVGVMVALVLVGATMPIWADTLATEDTFKNEGYYRMSEFEYTDTAYTITWDISKPAVFTINDIDYNMSEILTTRNQYFTIVATDGAYLRVACNGDNRIVVQSHNSVGNPLIAFDSSNTTMTSMTITIDGDSYDVTRITDSTITVSASYSEFAYVFDPTGPYVMKYSDKTAYVVDEDIIILAGVTRTTDNNTEVAIYGYGTVEGITLTSVYPDDDTTYSDVVINHNAVDSHVGLNTISSVTFDMSRNDTTTHATYSYFLVPYEVTADRSVSMSGALGALVSIIPLLIVAGLVVGAVVWFINRKG